MNRVRTNCQLRVEAVIFMLLMLLALVACDSVDAVSSADRAIAEAFVRKEQAPLSVVPIALWYANEESHAMCGEIEAPAALKRIRPTLRYVYFPDTKFGSVEPHELWIASDARGAAILQESRTIFGRTWSTMCESKAPLARRIADWWNDIDDYDDAPTPLTDAYARDLLNNSR